MSGSLRDLFSVRTGVNEPFDLTTIDTRPTAGVSRKKAEKQTDADRKRLARLQDRLWAEGTRSLLLVLQGMDTSGKDGTVKHVIGAMNPGGCRVVSFKAPTAEELKHDFLWRIRRSLPGPGQVGVFNRSHYEDVIVARVDNLVPEETWRRRFNRINAFERTLVKREFTVLKIFLHISMGEQRERLLKRLEDPTKRWKFKTEDLDHRARWNEFLAAYGDAIGRCSTDRAQWHVVPADAKWFRNWAIGRLIIETLEEMNPRYPEPVLDVETITARLDAPPPVQVLEPSYTTAEQHPEVVVTPDIETPVVVPDDARDLIETTDRTDG